MKCCVRPGKFREQPPSTRRCLQHILRLHLLPGDLRQSHLHPGLSLLLCEMGRMPEPGQVSVPTGPAGSQ